MTRRDDSRIIMIVHPICCGLDVHKKSVSACIIFPDGNGEEQHEVKVFGTFTDDLIRLRDWLAEHNCPVVAMESTGVYWRPVHNVLEDPVNKVASIAPNQCPGRPSIHLRSVLRSAAIFPCCTIVPSTFFTQYEIVLL